MGTTRFEFGPDELCLSGGDYGSVSLDGLTATARRTLDTITEATRLSGGRSRVSLVVDLDDVAPPVIEARHAGREGTPESGVGQLDLVAAAKLDARGDEGVDSEGAAVGEAADSP